MNRKGFSLLEVIVSALILSIITIGSFTMLITAREKLNEALIRLQASNQAETVLEKLRWYVCADTNPSPYSGPSTNAGGVLTTEGAFTDGSHSPTDINLSASPDMPDIAYSPVWGYDVSIVSGSNCRQVEVVVGWD